MASKAVNPAPGRDDQEPDPLTKEEDAVQEFDDGRIEKVEFDTVDEFIRWLNE